MGLTIAKVPEADRVEANKRRHVRDITFDTTYPDNGEPLAADDVGLNVLEEVIPHGPFRAANGATAVIVSYDHTNGKLLAYVCDADAQDPLVENTTADISAYSGRVTFIGR